MIRKVNPAHAIHIHGDEDWSSGMNSRQRRIKRREFGQEVVALSNEVIATVIGGRNIEKKQVSALQGAVNRYNEMQPREGE